MRKSVIVTLGTVFVGLTACGDVLGVKNTNNPSVESSFSTSKGVELLIAGMGPQLNNTQRATESVNTQSKILAGESFASVANFGMAARAQIPRSLISNELGNDNQTGNLSNFNNFQRYARNASQAINRLNELKAGGDSLATAADRRAKAFAYSVIGQALGNLSLMYDSAAIITPASAPASTVPGAIPEPLASAAAVNAAAIRMLDSAVTYATGMSALPTTWISTAASTDAATFTRLVRSYRARLRAGVARTAAERAAVDWTAVIADATNGIITDFLIQIGGSTGWSATFDVSQSYVAGGWHQIPLLYIGFADTTNAMNPWLVEDINLRRAFLLRTPDRRWPAGDTRAAQTAKATSGNALPTVPCDSANQVAGGIAPANITRDCAMYIRNRPSGSDVPIIGFGESFYDHRRHGATNVAGNLGPYVEMSRTEIDMLAAEGYLRLAAPNYAAAEALINRTRLKNGLVSVTGVGAGTVPGGTACVPRVPQTAPFQTVTCGTLFEAMKYEKRMETMMTGYAISFTDSRGWGDLVGGTVVEWPVPYQEMQTRQQAYYNGTRRAPTPSTYGY